MKILMATMGLDIGGAETHIVELSKQLKQQGHDIAIISNGGVYVPEIIAAGIEHGILFLSAKDKVRLLPPLNITYAEIDEALAAVESALA